MNQNIPPAGFNADGARAMWVLRQLYASDWASGGFTSQSLWARTNSSQNNFVEVGVTQGWQGQNIYTYYTAHVYGGLYGERRITSIAPQLGTTHRFALRKAANFQKYQVGIDGNNYDEWQLHSVYTPSYDIGLETTCNETAMVNRTYVSENQARRYSDSTWNNAPDGYLTRINLQTGGAEWCSFPVTFRYFLRSQIDTLPCS